MGNDMQSVDEAPGAPAINTAEPSEQSPAVEADQRAGGIPEEVPEGHEAKNPEGPPVIEVPPEVREMREECRARQFFSPQMTFRDAYTEAMIDETEELKGLPAETRAAILEEAREIAADAGFSLADINTLRDIDRQIKANPPTTETRAAWREEAIDRMNREFGNDAAQAMRDARTFIAKDPRFAHALELNGRGDHPETVMTFARLARRARMEGRLK